MGLNRYQLTFESYGDHYQIYRRDIQDVMGGGSEVSPRRAMDADRRGTGVFLWIDRG